MLLLPTIFLVMVVAFFLSKSVPGDAADAMLALHGVNLESPSAKVEYERYYKSLNLDKPVFYFSIIPHFYPDNIHSIVSSTERQQVEALLKQKLPFVNAQNYIREKNKSSLTIIEQIKNLDSAKQEDIKSLLSKANFETDIDKIPTHWMSIKKNLPDSTVQNVDIFAISEKLTSSVVNFYYPVLRWHGFTNQFHVWIVKVLHFDLGISIKDGRLVAQKILSAFKWTLLLSLINVFFSTLIAIPSGVLAGYKPGSWMDKFLGVFWLLLYSIPVFWLASMLIVYCTSSRYGVWLDIFPVPGLWYIPDGQSMWSTIVQYSHQLILPVICLVANDIAQLSRIVRNNVIEQKYKMYVLMAKAKGVSDLKLLTNHIVPNVMIPLITVIGGKLPAGLSGALIIEVIFNIPGMGRLMYNSIFHADWNVVFGILIVVSLATMLVMLISDILYAYANPKIKTGMS